MKMNVRAVTLATRAKQACMSETGQRRLQAAASLAAPLALVAVPGLAHAQDMGGDFFGSMTALLRGGAREVIGNWFLYIGALALGGTFIAGCLSAMRWSYVLVTWVAIGGAFFSPRIVTGLRDLSGVMSF